jgi:membrane-associated phospholipid phosphatase
LCTCRFKIFFLFVLIFVFDSSLIAQNHYNFRQFTNETGDFLKLPVKWHSNDWLRLGLVTTGTILIMQVDEPIRNAVLRGDRSYSHSIPIEAGRIWGEGYTPPIIIGAFGLHGWLADNSSSKKISFEVLQATVYAEIVAGALKIATGRSRPYANKGAFSFHPFNIFHKFTFSAIGLQSFPGGHNTVGWAMSTVLARNAHSTALKIVAYTPAALTFIARIYQDKHWTSDQFIGATIGFVVGNWVVNLHKKKESMVKVSPIYPFSVSIRF